MIGQQPEVDTTVNIWEWYFKVKVPYLQSRPIELMKLIGTPVSGVKEIDKDIQNQWIVTMMPIAYMVELYQKGIPVSVVLPSDTKQIYDFISQHIYAWKRRLEVGINIGDAPIDDLIAMDEFAHLVYEHARYQFTRETADSIISRHLTGLQRFNIHTFFNRDVVVNLNNKDGISSPVTRINHDEEDHVPDRDSLSDFFKDRIISLRSGKRW